MIGVTVKSADASRRFVADAAQVEPRTRAVTNHYATLLEARTRAAASHAPGPEVDTGAYVASIERRGTTVGSDHPAAHRLEAGFAGVDSRGHRVHQEPRPHFGPALDSVDDPFVTTLAATVLPR